MLTLLTLQLISSAPDGGASRGLLKILSTPSDGGSSPLNDTIGDIGVDSRPSSRAEVEIGPSKIDGAVPTAAEVDRYFQARRAALRACYERQLAANPALKGQVQITLEITPAGAAKDVEVSSLAGAGGAEVTTCLKSMIRSWRFPFLDETSAKVELSVSCAPRKTPN